MNLSKYNPFPLIVWSMLFISMCAGFFIGATYESYTIRYNTIKTKEFFCGRP